ncbi:MAG: DUF3500 domain-containing protein [Hyphomicrobiales bacterium]|nr:DUF3500 domain-containing protein [Hyphomicrobiales bacterium]
MEEFGKTKRIFKYPVATVIVLAVIIAGLLQYPRLLAGVFFGADTLPVEISLRSLYEPRETDGRTRAIVAASDAFLNSLDDQQKQAAMYAFDDNAQRSNWSNLPESIVPRGGLKIGRLAREQRALLDALLGEIMSKKGAQNIDYQLAAEDAIPSGKFFEYHSEDFYVAFLGEPSVSRPWMFQFGGHHLAINVTIYGADVTFSPMLTGGQPLHIHYGGKDVFIIEEEVKAAQALMDSLSAQQQEIAVRGTEPVGLLLGPGKYGEMIAPEGIRGSDLTEVQKQLLLKLIDARLSFINSDDHAEKMATVAAELDDTYFGWWGETTGKPGFSYFRVTAPSTVLEYSPQDDVDAGGGIGHVHSMYRNPKNDYGSAWIEDKK